MIGSTVVAGEECIFSVQSKGPDGTLDGVGVHLDASVVREQDEAVPVVKSIANGLGHFGAAGNEGQGLFDPGLELIEERPAPGLADLAARFGAFSADGLFDFVKRCDLNECLFGERRVAANGDLVEPPPQMGPAEGQDERRRWRPVACEVLVGGIAVNLQNAAEAREMAFHMLRSAPRRIAIDNSWRIGAAPGPVVAGISPELAALHTLAPRIEDGAACLVGKQFRRGLEDLEQPGLQRRQKRRGPSHWRLARAPARRLSPRAPFAPKGQAPSGLRYRPARALRRRSWRDSTMICLKTHAKTERYQRYCTAWGRARRTALTRAQSRPSNKADACAGDRRMTPSSILGQRNFASSSRL